MNRSRRFRSWVGAGLLLLLVIGFWLTPERSPMATDPAKKRVWKTGIQKPVSALSKKPLAEVSGQAGESPKSKAADDEGSQQLSFSSSLRKGPWSEPLQRLILKGNQGPHVEAELTALLECQPGIGDQLMQLLLEGQGTLSERSALLVALGVALSLQPVPEEMWIDRRGVLEWAVEMWIEGMEDFEHLGHWLWTAEGIDGNLAFTLIDQFLADPDRYPVDSEIHQRWRRAVTEGLKTEMGEDAPAWLKQWTLEWLETEDAEFREVALGVLGPLYASSDPDLQKNLLSRIRSWDVPSQLEAGREILGSSKGPQLESVLEDWADFFIRNEYRGSELLVAFHRAREQPLKPILYRRGDSADSERYRLWVLHGALGGLNPSGEYPADWQQTLEETARLDPAQVVRFLALRLCAMVWGERSKDEFVELLRRADVNGDQQRRALDLWRANRKEE